MSPSRRTGVMVPVPTVRGHGRRLFPDRWEQPSLTLREARSFRNGQALLRYAAG